MVNARPGFSHVEVAVAALLLSVAVLSVAGGGAAALRMLAAAEREQGALIAGAAVLDSLAQQPAAGSGTVQRPPFRIDWDAADTANVIRIRVVIRAQRSANDSILALVVLAITPLRKGPP